MRILAVFCHPDRASFGAKVLDTFCSTATSTGHELKVIDLYAEKFDPVLAQDEWRSYSTEGLNEVPVREHIEKLRWAEALIFIYPTWWYSQPAMLKGWIDRVWVPHVTFTLPTPDRAMAPLMFNIRMIGAITTLGSPWWWWNVVMGAPGRKVLLRGVRACCHPRTRTFFLGLHSVDTSNAESRQRFLDRVARKARTMR